MFYVYAYLRSKDSNVAKAGTPYYIGKGKDGRAWDKRHLARPPTDKINIIIMESNLTEIGALALERFYIKWWGRVDLGTGILRNKTEGGEGASGAVRSEDTKLKISRTLMGHTVSLESRKKLSVKHTGKKATQETKDKLSKAGKGRTSHRKGKTIPNDVKEKISKSTTGIRKSEETKQKMKSPKQKIKCIYCHVIGGKPSMVRWHFDQCRERL